MKMEVYFKILKLLRKKVLFVPNIIWCTIAYCILLLTFTFLFYDVILNIVWEKHVNNGDRTNLKFAIYQSEENLNILPNQTYSKYVTTILKTLKLKRVEPESNWNFLWADEIYFENFASEYNLKKNQIINKFPGSSALTNTRELFSSTNFDFIPKSFLFPEYYINFEKYRESHPERLIIIKNKDKQYLLKNAYSIKESEYDDFIQEFIYNPITIDGFKFDISCFIAVTHTNPLRVYIYTQDCYIKFCTENHRYFTKVSSKYIVPNDQFLPIWKIKPLEIYYKSMKMGFKDSFNMYLKKSSYDLNKIWTQIENISSEIILFREKELNPYEKKYDSNFFEVFKFDFIITARSKVYLMNIESLNYLPNYKRDFPLITQVIHNVLQLKGVIRPLERIDLKNNLDVDPMLSTKSYLAVDGKHCIDYKCNEICVEQCYLCMNCINETDLNILHQTYREHIYRYDMKRIFPKPIVLGQWYEVERSFYLPEIASGCTKLTFQPEDKNYRFEDSYFRLEVSIKTINRITGNPSISLGFAKPENAKSSIMDFKFQTRFPEILSRFLPGSGRYQVLYTDYDNFAILWSCSSFGPLGHADQIWVFGRAKDFNAEIRLKIYETLKKLSLDPNRLIISKNKNCPNSL